MKQNNKGGFNWAIVFAWLFGIVGVAGVMYLLFTNEDYNGMGGTGIDSSFITQTDASVLDSAKKEEKPVPKVADKTPKTNIEKEVVKTIDAPPAKPQEKPIEKKPEPPVKKPAPPPAVVKTAPVTKPTPAPVKQPAPVPVKPTPVVVKNVPAQSKQASVQAKPTQPIVAKPKPTVTKPAPPVVKTTPPAASKPATVVSKTAKTTTKTAAVVTTVKPKPSKPRPDKSLSEDEMENIVNDILSIGEQNGIYIKCVQLRGTADGNNKIALEQLESFLRRKKFTIAGRETEYSDAKGIKITPGNGFMKLTVGSL